MEDRFKVKLVEMKENKTKKLIIKTLICQKILIKHSKERARIRIYTDFPIEEGRTCDVYYDNIRKKEVVVYDIKTNVQNKWVVNAKKFYGDWKVYGMDNSKWVLVRVEELSNDLDTLNKQIKEIVI